MSVIRMIPVRFASLGQVCLSLRDVQIWDFPTCRAEHTMTGHGGDIKSCAWHPTKAVVASGSKDGLVKVCQPFCTCAVRLKLLFTALPSCPEYSDLASFHRDEPLQHGICYVQQSGRHVCYPVVLLSVLVDIPPCAALAAPFACLMRRPVRASSRTCYQCISAQPAAHRCC